MACSRMGWVQLPLAMQVLQARQMMSWLVPAETVWHFVPVCQPVH